MNRRNGYTLVESILSIALVGLLITLVFPTIAKVRSRAWDLVSTSNLRTHTQTLSVYAIDWDDSFIHFTRPGADATILDSCGERALYRYFMNTPMWYRPIAEEYYGSCEAESLYMPQRIDEAREINQSPWDYFLTAAAVAAPGYWRLETRTGRAQWGTQRLSAVRFPSDKAAFTAGAISPGQIGHPGGRVGMGMIDGSGGWFPKHRLVEPVHTGDGMFHEQWIFVSGHYGIHTPDGVLGRDIGRN